MLRIRNATPSGWASFKDRDVEAVCLLKEILERIDGGGSAAYDGNPHWSFRHVRGALDTFSIGTTRLALFGAHHRVCFAKQNCRQELSTRSGSAGSTVI